MHVHIPKNPGTLKPRSATPVHAQAPLSHVHPRSSPAQKTGDTLRFLETRSETTDTLKILTDTLKARSDFARPKLGQAVHKTRSKPPLALKPRPDFLRHAQK